MTSANVNRLHEAIQQILNNEEIMKNYPKGITGREMLYEIRKHIAPFQMVSALDVMDELSLIFNY